jgi:hypothetical protein
MVPQQAGGLPALAQVLQQGLAPELNQHIDGVDAGVDQIAQDEVDDPVPASERNGGFGAFLGERIKPRAPAPGQHERKNPELYFASFWQQG